MNSSEWSLLFFTLIGQFSAGVTLALFLFSLLHHSSDHVKPLLGLRYGLITASLSIITALVISFLHLSAPFSSVYALSNLRNSWLSREIFMVSAYAAVIVFVTLYEWKSSRKVYLTSLLLLSAIAGLSMVYSMGRLYMIETVPVWNTPKTLLVFYGTTFLLGFSFVLVILLNQMSEKMIKPFVFIILLMLVIKSVCFFMDWKTENTDPMIFTQQHLPKIWKILWWSWIPGFFILTGIRFKKNLRMKKQQYFYTIAFIFFVIAEFAARVIFYASYFRIGV